MVATVSGFWVSSRVDANIRHSLVLGTLDMMQNFLQQFSIEMLDTARLLNIWSLPVNHSVTEGYYSSWHHFSFAILYLRSSLVLTTDLWNPRAVLVYTSKKVKFGSSPIQKPNPHHFGRPNPDPITPTSVFFRVGLHPSFLISGCSFGLFLFMVIFRYPSVLCKILTLVHHCLCLFYWLPS